MNSIEDPAGEDIQGANGAMAGVFLLTRVVNEAPKGIRVEAGGKRAVDRRNRHGVTVGFWKDIEVRDLARGKGADDKWAPTGGDQCGSK